MKKNIMVVVLFHACTHGPDDGEKSADSEPWMDSDVDTVEDDTDSPARDDSDDTVIETVSEVDTDQHTEDSDTDIAPDTSPPAPLWVPTCTQRMGAFPLMDFVLTSSRDYWSLDWWETSDANANQINEVMYCRRADGRDSICKRVDFVSLRNGVDPGEVLFSMRTDGTADGGGNEDIARTRGRVDLDGDGVLEVMSFQWQNWEYDWMFHRGTATGDGDILQADWVLSYPYNVPYVNGEPMASGDIDGNGQGGDIVTAPASGWLWTPDGNPSQMWIDRGPFASGFHEMGDPDFMIREDDPTNTFGTQVLVEDVNLDGQVDIVVSDQTIGTLGAVYIFLGPITSSRDTSAADATFTTDSPHAVWAHFGENISLGDANGDHLPDLLVSARQWGEGGRYAGAAFLFHGPLTQSRTTSQAEFRLIGDQADGGLGMHVKFLGDANGDGRDDFGATAPDWRYSPPPCDTGCTTPQESGQGAAFIFYDDPRGTFTPGQAPLILFDNRPDGRAPYSLWRAGDLNGDGQEDLVTEDPREPDGMVYGVTLCEPPQGP